MNNQAHHFASSWTEKWFGFWAEEAALSGVPFSLENHVDDDWNPADKMMLLAYLRASPVAIFAQTHNVKCGLCDVEVRNSCYQSDGFLLWDAALVHLVDKHSFVIPDLFVAHIRSRDYVAPTSLVTAVMDLPWPK